MFPFRNHKMLVCAGGTLVVYGFMILSLRRDPENVDKNPTLSNLANYIWRHETHLQNHPRWNKDCAQKYGHKMISDWKLTRFELCRNNSTSKISCYLRYDAAVTRRLCVLDNTEVRLYEPYYNITTTNLSLASEVTMRSDIVSADCDREELIYDGRKERLLQYDSLLKVDEFTRSTKSSLQCDYNVRHTVFWIWRWDATNAYHFMEDITNTFVSLILLDEDPYQVEIAIYDGMKGNVDNPLFTLWSQLFPKGVRIIRNNPFPSNTCFIRSITAMYGVRSHLTEYGGYNMDTQCSSPILKGCRDWVTDRLQIKYNNKNSVESYTIIFLSRQQYLSTRIITRVLSNEHIILQAIKEKYPSLNIIVFRPENFTTFKEQVEIVAQGRIMIGVHGAGLIYSVFMARGSQLIEIFMEDRSSANRHYHNVASWMDLGYHSIGHYGKVVPPDDIVSVIGKAIRNLS